MAKILYEHGETYKTWEAWADRLGWKLVYVETGTDKSEPHAVVKDANGREERVSLTLRQALASQQSNVSTLRSGTDG